MIFLRFIWFWGPVGAYMGLAWYLGENDAMRPPEFIPDKLLHLGAYAFFGVLCMRAFHGGLRTPVWTRTLPALAVTIGYFMLLGHLLAALEVDLERDLTPLLPE